ncbi:MAG: hypothetical protein IPL97_05870 [Niastella sp.]|nr:hypothetical protein [Niastella sp.]
MSNDLELFHNILLIDRPWLSATTDQKYQQLLQMVSKENYAQQPFHELSFPKALTPKRKYFFALIDNEARRYINTIHSLMKDASNENEKKYWIHNTLTKKLKDKFTETEKAITANQFFFSVINDRQQTSKHKDDAYVIQLLKFELIRIYVEIQNSFLAYLKEDPLTEADILSTYFQSEEAPEKSFIISAPDYKLPKGSQPIEIKEEVKFQPIKADIRTVPKGILKYTDIISNPDKFAAFETELFYQGLINQQYEFAKKRGQVTEMAAAYHVISKKKYFNQFYFPGRKKVTELHIRKFLNLRYKASIDKEFRNFNDKEVLEEYLPSKPWLTLIIPS